MEELISRLRSSGAVMRMLPELPGYNGSVFTIDDTEAERIDANISDAIEALTAEREISDKLEREIERQKHYNYNSFEPDNQGDNYKRICVTLAEVAAIRGQA